ncbi:MAG: VWA domain-containing protein [Candidatus Omnitrophica bacterium]|nr:VWA domain-containing protein [Candidatus Omnitrophota bacterium]MDD5671822.1 VWA domain-containing protein [Candidatus Omnitrophota bacterium]
MNPRCFKFFHRRDCRGQALVFGPLFVFALLIVGGLTVDTANAFLVKAKLRRALDASAIAGIIRFSNGETDTTDIENDSGQLIHYNLHQMGIPDSQITDATAEFTIDENHVGTLSLSASLRVPTLFMCLIPNAGLEFINVSASSTSRRFPAVISLVLDTSGSMAGTKIQALKNAAKTFVDSFQENIDQIAIIQFGSTAAVLQPMALVNKNALHAIIDDLSSEGWTNISNAIALGRIEIESADNPNATFDPVKAMLIFTDGAPNVFRGIFTNGRVPPLVRNFPQPTPTSCAEYLNAGNTPTLVIDAYTDTTRCSGTYSSADIRNCFNSLLYLDSRLNQRVNSGAISRTIRSEQLKESYNLAIVETDYAKTDGVLIYTIGLGSQATEGSDPYQSVTNFNPIKSYFLRRLANDARTDPDPDFPNLPNPANHPRGIYLQTPDPEDLEQLFRMVSTKLKSRLVA